MPGVAQVARERALTPLLMMISGCKLFTAAIFFHSRWLHEQGSHYVVQMPGCC